MDYGSNSFWIGLPFKTLITLLKDFIPMKLCKASPENLQLSHPLSIFIALFIPPSNNLQFPVQSMIFRIYKKRLRKRPVLFGIHHFPKSENSFPPGFSLITRIFLWIKNAAFSVSKIFCKYSYFNLYFG